MSDKAAVTEGTHKKCSLATERKAYVAKCDGLNTKSHTSLERRASGLMM